jgi:hypothetical protein
LQTSKFCPQGKWAPCLQPGCRYLQLSHNERPWALALWLSGRPLFGHDTLLPGAKHLGKRLPVHWHAWRCFLLYSHASFFHCQASGREASTCPMSKDDHVCREQMTPTLPPSFVHNSHLGSPGFHDASPTTRQLSV